VVGQFPAEAGGTTDEFGIVLEKDSPLTSCVDDAITALTDSGELDAITTKWLSENADVPVISTE
jgi:polar amino acid transport system substrate-binding protein